MIKNILMFRRDKVNHDSLNYWTELISEQFRKRKINVHILSITDDPQTVALNLMSILSSSGIDAALAVNAIGQQNYMDGDGNNLWDSLGIPFFNWIVDHPLEHGSDIISNCSNYNIICVDQNHADFIKRFYPSVKTTHFLPLAGFGNSDITADDHASFMSREYDVVLTAGLWDPDDIKSDIMRLPDAVRTIALDWTAYMENHLSETPEEALWDVLQNKYGKDMLSDPVYLKIADSCHLAIPYIRTWIRKRIVVRLMESGLQFHLWGNGWDGINRGIRNSRAVLHGDIYIKDTAKIYRSTKLAINILPMFKCGTHDRITTAQLNGAAMITDDNEYLRSLYQQEEIFFYRLDDIDDLPERITMILNNADQLYETAIRGQKTANERLTWDISGDRLISIIENSLGMP